MLESNCEFSMGNAHVWEGSTAMACMYSWLDVSSLLAEGQS